MYHHISLILCLLYSPRPLLPIPAVITHLRQSPSFLSTRAQPSFQIPTVCVPPPAILTLTLPSSDAPYSPHTTSTILLQSYLHCHLPKQPLSHLSHHTRKAQRAGPGGSSQARQSPWCFLPWTGPRLAVRSSRVLSRPLGIIPTIPLGPPEGSEHWPIPCPVPSTGREMGIFSTIPHFNNRPWFGRALINY